MLNNNQSYFKSFGCISIECVRTDFKYIATILLIVMCILNCWIVGTWGNSNINFHIGGKLTQNYKETQCVNNFGIKY